MGKRGKVMPLARAIVAAGADLLIEVHHDPEKAVCDSPQSLYPDQFARLMDELRIIAPAVGQCLSVSTWRPTRALTFTHRMILFSHKNLWSHLVAANNSC